MINDLQLANLWLLHDRWVVLETRAQVLSEKIRLARLAGAEGASCDAVQRTSWAIQQNIESTRLLFEGIHLAGDANWEMITKPAKEHGSHEIPSREEFERERFYEEARKILDVEEAIARAISGASQSEDT